MKKIYFLNIFFSNCTVLIYFNKKKNELTLIYRFFIVIDFKNYFLDLLMFFQNVS